MWLRGLQIRNESRLIGWTGRMGRIGQTGRSGRSGWTHWNEHMQVGQCLCDLGPRGFEIC